MTNSLSIGLTETLTAATVYALPMKSVRIAVYQSGGTIAVSVDNSHWQTVTLDSNSEFVTAAAFIKAVTTNAIVTVKEV